MKLTKEQTKNHDKAEELLLKDELSFDDKYFVLENWLPAATNNIGKVASFFTPRMMANDFCYEAGSGNVIDLCAGIGMLSFQLNRFLDGKVKLTCLEINPDFVRVGKKILPEANWIKGDVLDEDLIKSIGSFDCVISNPPFGKIKTGSKLKWLKYQGTEFEYKVIEVGNFLARYRGAFILPQLSCPFRISGMYNNQVMDEPYITDKYRKFSKETGLDLTPNCGFDLSSYVNQWNGTNQMCEIAICEYEELRSSSHDKNDKLNEDHSTHKSKQLSLFD